MFLAVVEVVAALPLGGTNAAVMNTTVFAPPTGAWAMRACSALRASNDESLDHDIAVCHVKFHVTVPI
jgi:hypothetical protein